ncbi:hypothetical protein SAMN04490239_1234 [Rhodococcus koreensis]|uniref:Uncharacterized protein n=1 Tax=Rhodococcus koreensis TaxID=99653 RepID=A0A1H4LE20_9NOCA|nr:hypothetical protein SAMN04490239_1234 [Rhodococcus koreensis]
MRFLWSPPKATVICSPPYAHLARVRSGTRVHHRCATRCARWRPGRVDGTPRRRHHLRAQVHAAKGYDKCWRRHRTRGAAWCGARHRAPATSARSTGYFPSTPPKGTDGADIVRRATRGLMTTPTEAGHPARRTDEVESRPRPRTRHERLRLVRGTRGNDVDHRIDWSRLSAPPRMPAHLGGRKPIATENDLLLPSLYRWRSRLGRPVHRPQVKGVPPVTPSTSPVM